MIRVWSNPRPFEVAPEVNGFLQQLGGPALIQLTGEDSTRTRVLVTLSHGNEPSGLEAVHQWLLSGEKPVVNVVVLLGAVRAALLQPLFYYRQPPGERDLNRCFGSPGGDEQGKLALEMLQLIHARQPEALVDLHNTSGLSPAFAVTMGDTPEIRSLVSLFVQHMIVTGLRLESLMEQSLGCPLVTIEAGGAQDESSILVAARGIRRYFTARDVLDKRGELETFHQPLRLELREHSRIGFAGRALPGHDITLRADIEKFNATPLRQKDMIGWLAADGLSHLEVCSDAGQPRQVEEYFKVEQGRLFPLQAIRLFMATTRPDVAASDCLFYFLMDA